MADVDKRLTQAEGGRGVHGPKETRRVSCGIKKKKNKEMRGRKRIYITEVMHFLFVQLASSSSR